MSALPVTARFRVKPGAEAAALASLGELVDHTRAEPGCLSYEYLRAMDDPAALTSLEIWASPEEERA